MLKKTISKLTLLDLDQVSQICDKSNNLYSFFTKSKPNGGLRIIYHPSKELKLVQIVLNDFIIKKLPTHDASKAYKKGCSTKNNALVHSHNKYFLRMDFKSFFESITSKDIYDFIDREMPTLINGWNKDDSISFTKLVCRRKKLVMGSVTSPALSNAICFELDTLIQNYCTKVNVHFSRYADDLYFSTNKKNLLKHVENEVIKIVENLKCPSNLKINTSKTFHSSHKRRVIITGLVITNQGNVSVGRKKKREIRSKIYNWENLNDDEKVHLSGYLSYVEHIDPMFINSLCMKYGSNIIRDIIQTKL
ncbi:retron St85 family RNA-directed DNA polymerase [Photobacterium sp. 1_MG-2023]|uniref:retron St85 family RNA-directed DNA polymerase n=1 Tax=Photobacterium sp. 1_MG-2023 TaxID=3062646 RepID=UPI0026E13EDC|nr:retron St85 family RNA-directed DNA polymerase [Photobacterium sp. 1_MG-2023]MDO6706748.1 retron St85 family RNA-directed DNA polymerase [Photobacterium sp. 1_MG-2023]